MILLLTGFALLLFLALLAGLVWSIRSGQWDDLDTPAQRMLGDDAPASDSGPTAPRETL
jgi:cbb3-type cytochrome oxidase maturation protein